jgi:hypothetical protein
MQFIRLSQAARKALEKKSAGEFVQRNATALVAALAIALAGASAASAQVDNTADGHNALKNNTTGSQDSAFGNVALEANTSGSDNTHRKTGPTPRAPSSRFAHSSPAFAT